MGTLFSQQLASEHYGSLPSIYFDGVVPRAVLVDSDEELNYAQAFKVDIEGVKEELRK
jgi:hypothetical protein